MKNPGLIDQEKNKTRAGFEVSLIPWIALSEEEVIPIPADWLVTMLTPVEQLKKMYIEDVLSYGQDDQSDSTDDQPDPGESD